MGFDVFNIFTQQHEVYLNRTFGVLVSFVYFIWVCDIQKKSEEQKESNLILNVVLKNLKQIVAAFLINEYYIYA